MRLIKSGSQLLLVRKDECSQVDEYAQRNAQRDAFEYGSGDARGGGNRDGSGQGDGAGRGYGYADGGGHGACWGYSRDAKGHVTAHVGRNK